MPASPSSSVQAARQAVASRLREIRTDAGITKRELAVRCGWSESKSSRIEAGHTPPSDADLRAWCHACDAEDLTDDLIAANRAADSMYVQWKRLQRTGLRRLQESSVGLYEETLQFRIYCSNVIPGFLQTPGYATALLTSIARFRGTPDDVTQAVAARVERSGIVRDGRHRFAMVIEESALRYRIGDADAMAGQLGHLLSVMSMPAVSFGIIPAATLRTMWPLETFTIFDDTRVHTESLTAAIKMTEHTDIEMHGKAFTELSAMAVYGAPARALIAEAIAAVGE
jgi:transcriptional regulator with XRE-family HTH domain